MLRRLIRFTLCYHFIININCFSNLRHGEYQQLFNEEYTAKVENDYNTRSHVFKEGIQELSSRTDLLKRDRIYREYVHEVVFAIRQRNMDELTRLLHDVSNPMSSNYGQHWTREEVTNFTSNPDAHEAVVSYLLSNGVSHLSETLGGEYIKANAPIAVWEKMFNTEFFTFHQTHQNNRVQEVVRAVKYWIPRELDRYIDCVFYTIEMPIVRRNSLQQNNLPPKSELKSKIDSTAWIENDFMTSDKIKKYYNITDDITDSNVATHAIYANDDGDFSQSDINQFQLDNELQFQNIAEIDYDKKNINANNSNDDVGTNLNLQFMVDISSSSTPIYSFIPNNDFVLWLIKITNTSNSLPLVLNVDWSYDENTCSNGFKSILSIQTKKLSLMGITILATSGLNGANGGNMKCGYNPDFLSGCPYITSLGSTMVRLYIIET